MANAEVQMTLVEAVEEVLGQLTGLDLAYVPESDRFRSVTRALNQATRANALEFEWSYYSSSESIGPAIAGVQTYTLRQSVRPRMVNDDSVQLCLGETPVTWAYSLPRDAIGKYAHRPGLWYSVTRSTLLFSRPLSDGEAGLDIRVPVMREPRMFRLPKLPTDPEEEMEPVDEDILEQTIDFDYPDIITARAAYLYALSDPVYQPRAETLENIWKQIGYALVEREERHTDSPFLNEFNLPMDNDIFGTAGAGWGIHPHADERR